MRSLKKSSLSLMAMAALLGASTPAQPVQAVTLGRKIATEIPTYRNMEGRKRKGKVTWKK